MSKNLLQAIKLIYLYQYKVESKLIKTFLLIPKAGKIIYIKNHKTMSVPIFGSPEAEGCSRPVVILL